MLLGKLQSYVKELSWTTILYDTHKKTQNILKTLTQVMKLQNSQKKQVVSTSTQVLDMISLELTPKNQGNKSKNKQMRVYQTQKHLHSKGNHPQNEKATSRMGKTYLKIIDLIRSLFSNIYKELLQFNSKNANNLNFKWEKDLRRHFFFFSKEVVQVANTYMKRKVLRITNHQGNINPNHNEKSC